MKILKYIGLGVLLVLLLVLLFSGVVLFVPAVQTAIVQQITTHIDQTTGAHSRVGKVSFSPLSGLTIDELLLQDPQKDTLAYVGELQVAWDFSGLVQSEKTIEKIRLDSVIAHVDMSKEQPNYQYLMDAFGVVEDPNAPVDTTASTLRLALDDIAFSRLWLDFEDSTTAVNAYWHEGQVKAVKVNLADEIYRIASVDSDSLNAHVVMIPSDSVAQAPEPTDSTNTDSPSRLQFYLGHLGLKRHMITYATHRGNLRKGTVFDPDNIGIQQLELSVDSIGYRSEEMYAKLNGLSFYEHNGFHMKKLSSRLRMKGEDLYLIALAFRSDDSKMDLDAHLRYKGVERGKLAQNIFDLKLEDFYLGAHDINYWGAKTAGLRLTPEDYIQGYGTSDIKGGKGKIFLQLNTSRESQLTLNGAFKTHNGAPRLYMDSLLVKSHFKEATWLMTEQEWNANPHPDSIYIATHGWLDEHGVSVNGQVNSDWGKMSLVADLLNIDDLPRLKYDADLKFDDFRVQRIVGEQVPDHLNGHITAHGQGTEFPQLTTAFTIEHFGFDYLQKSYRGIEGNGQWKDGIFEINIDSELSDLPLMVKADGHYGDQIDVQWKIHLDPLDLSNFGVMDQMFKLGFNSDGKAKMVGEKINVDGNIDDLSIQQKTVDTGFDHLSIQAYYDGDSVHTDVSGDPLDLHMEGVVDPDKWQNYFKTLATGTLDKARDRNIIPWISLKVNWKKHDLYTSGLIPGLLNLERGGLLFVWDDRQSKFNLKIDMPELKMDSLQVYGFNGAILNDSTERESKELGFKVQLDSAFLADGSRVQTLWDGQIFADSLVSKINVRYNNDTIKTGFDCYRDLLKVDDKKAGFAFENLQYNKMLIGNIFLDVISQKPEIYDAKLLIKGKQRLKGEAHIDLNKSPLYAKGFIDLDTVDLHTYQPMMKSTLDSLSGIIQGKVDFEYKNEKPIVDGALNFIDVFTRLKEYPMDLLLKNESVKLTKSAVIFKHFGLTDHNGKRLELKGDIGLTDNYPMDLKIEADPFLALDAPKTKQAQAFGQLNISTDLSIQGSAFEPKIEGEFNVLDKTDLFVRTPESQGAPSGHDKVIRFVKPDEELEQMLTEAVEDSLDMGFLGPEVHMSIGIDPKAKFTVLVDEYSGDRLEISGRSDLSLNYLPNGTTGLNGNFEVESGFYQLSFYGLVKKRFDFVKGSRITFTGTPESGLLDLTARYNISTAPYPIMVQRIDLGAAGQEKALKKKQNFYIDINIGNQIADPKISFSLGMPERDQGIFSGDVYARITEINRDEVLRNKQAVAVLITNSFLPDENASGGGNVMENVARSSVSQLVESSLNRLSNNLVKGVDINFAIDNYGDDLASSATEVGLNVSKSLYNDRLQVSVGGNMTLDNEQQSGSSQINEDIEIEYMLTQDGRYRLRGFRYRDNDDLLTQDLLTQGLSIVFSKDYNGVLKLFGKDNDKEKKNDQK
ncbi:translocation/assembly module TamB domain-containing protein [Persicobacter psychrovividus]|uniref:Translocation and assembly module TamB C-terminal domain-containing protein n=1 Tax=Persicobacter psychrovividus TaxID=387638 RepID=A0ABN6LCH7_9BACT|nr:hypothetical protein PEPS_31690 [Persicobacter psychrovividus]